MRIGSARISNPHLPARLHSHGPRDHPEVISSAWCLLSTHGWGVVSVSCLGAWIVTGGTHTGVMKHVGMAMRDYTLSSSAFDAQVVAIGVVTWGVVHNREPLVHPEVGHEASYTTFLSMVRSHPRWQSFTYLHAPAFSLRGAFLHTTPWTSRDRADSHV